MKSLLRRNFPLILLSLYLQGPLHADDHRLKNSDWVLVGPNKGWWKEVQIPLGYRVWLGEVGGPGVWLTLSNDTNAAFTVQWGNDQP